MIRAYHVIWGVYGFWLPNDPRGSWSEFVASWELARHGKPLGTMPRDMDRNAWRRWRAQAITSLRYPPVTLDGRQAQAIGVGFGKAVRKCKFTALACSILPQHVHLVLGRHEYDVEKMCIQLKGEATKQIKLAGLHPLANLASSGKCPSLWQVKIWKVFLHDDANIRAAIRYVEDNPVKEGKPAQQWSFVTAF